MNTGGHPDLPPHGVVRAHRYPPARDDRADVDGIVGSADGRRRDGEPERPVVARPDDGIDNVVAHHNVVVIVSRRESHDGRANDGRGCAHDVAHGFASRRRSRPGHRGPDAGRGAARGRANDKARR